MKNAATKDLKVLKAAMLPIFILSSVVAAIAILSVSISNAVTTDSGVRDRQRIIVEPAMSGKELVDNGRNSVNRWE